MGPEDPQEEGMVTHFNILAWKIPWTEGPDELQSMGLQTAGRGLAYTYHANLLSTLNRPLSQSIFSPVFI